MAEWSIATGCKPVGHSPTEVRILLGALNLFQNEDEDALLALAHEGITI